MSSTTEHTDEHLMELYQRGTHTALEVLYHRYSKPLLRFAVGMLNNDEQSAQDVLQDAFVGLAERPERFDTSRSFKPWIYAVVANASKKHYRKPQTTGTEILEYTVAQNSSDSGLDQQNFKKALREELARLKHEHRCVFILRYHERLSINEISSIMECSAGTVKSRIHYCLKHLSKRLHHFNPIQTD